MFACHCAGCFDTPCHCPEKRSTRVPTDYELSLLTPAELIDLMTRATKQLRDKVQVASYSSNSTRGQHVNAMGTCSHAMAQAHPVITPEE